MNSAAMYGRRGVSPMQARIAYGERRSTSGGAGNIPIMYALYFYVILIICIFFRT